MEDLCGFPAEEAFIRLDIMRDHNLPLPHFESALLAIGDPGEVFDSDEDFHTLKARLAQPSEQLSQHPPSRPAAKKAVNNSAAKASGSAKPAKQAVPAKPGTTPSPRPGVKAAPPKPLGPPPDRLPKGECLILTKAQVASRQQKQKDVALQEADRRKRDTPLRGNVTAWLGLPKAAIADPNKSKPKPPTKPTGAQKPKPGRPAGVVAPKPEVIDDTKFAPPHDLIKRVKAHVDSPQFRAFVKQLFDRLDTDRSGKLDQAEVRPLAHEVKQALRNDGFDLLGFRDQEIDRLLLTVDYDGDGVVDLDELHFCLKRMVVALVAIKPSEQARAA